MVVEMLTFLTNAFRLSWFCFFQRNQQSFQVFFQFVSVKVHFTDGGVDDAVLSLR